MGIFKKCRKGAAVGIGELLRVETDGMAAVLVGEGGSLRLTSPGPHLLRVRSGREGAFEDDHSYVVPDAVRSGVVAPEVTESAETVEVRFGDFLVVASRKPLGLSVYDRDDQLIFREYSPPGFQWKDEGIKLSHLCEPHARYHGFGEKTGPLNKRGQKMAMWNSDLPYTSTHDPLYISIPVTVVVRHGRAHGLFFDNPARSRFRVGSEHPWIFEYETDAGELDLYVIGGPAPAEVVERFTGLVGRTPLPPRWALGHHQCRWSYMNEDEVRRVAAGFRERDIPTDVIFMDIHYMDRYRVFTFNRETFPDVKKLSDDLRADGFRLAASVDPGVAAAEDFPLYVEGRDKGYYCKDEHGDDFIPHVWPGRVGMPDFSRDDVREWWGDAHRAFVDNGIEGVWNDMNEPSMWRGSVRIKDLVIPFPQYTDPRIVHEDGGRYTPHVVFRNLYGYMENKGAYEGLKRLRPGSRPFILSRAGYAGVQQYAAVWTGDNASTWAHLALTLPMLMNLGLSGVGICGPDIGGFSLNCTPELYARWVQLGAFYPYCRTHTMIRSRRQEPWSFGDEVTRIAREYLKLRYRLHPTLYSLMRACHETGAPVFRPLFYDFPDDRAAGDIEDQAMFGPTIMVAPVVKKGRRRRDVYLPEGGWTDFWTGQYLEGPKVVSRDAPLETMPLYIRAGAALVMWPALPWLNPAAVDRVFIELYPPASGRSETVWYEDDGETDGHERGEFCKRVVGQERRGDEILFQISDREGPFSPPARMLILKFHLDRRPDSVKLDGKSLSENGDGMKFEYLASERTLKVSWPDDFRIHECVIK